MYTRIVEVVGWIAFGGCAFIMAADTAVRNSVALFPKAPFMNSNWWGFAPIVLLSVVALAMAFKFLFPVRESHGAEWPPFDTRMEQVVGKYFVNEHVVVDGKQFDGCTFENVIFVNNGTARFQFSNTNKILGSLGATTPVPQLASMAFLNEYVRANGTTGRIVYGVRDPSTGKVLKEDAGFGMTHEAQKKQP